MRHQNTVYNCQFWPQSTPDRALRYFGNRDRSLSRLKFNRRLRIQFFKYVFQTQNSVFLRLHLGDFWYISARYNSNSSFLIVFYLRKDPVSKKYFTVLGIAVILKKTLLRRWLVGSQTKYISVYDMTTKMFNVSHKLLKKF